jgi:hypothetical protein
MKDESEVDNAVDTTLASSAMASATHKVEHSSVFNDFNQTHPSLFLSRSTTSDIER